MNHTGHVIVSCRLTEAAPGNPPDSLGVLENEVGNVHTTDGEWIVVHKRGGRRQSGKTIGWKNGTE